MRKPLLMLFLGLATCGAFAHETRKNPAAVAPGRETAQAVVQADPAAAGALAVVEAFTAALGGAELDKVAAELDPNVLILENGGAERSRAEYLGSHARHDAEFLKGAQVTLKRRRADVAGNLAWVASESEIRAMRGDEMMTISSVESMVLRNTTQGWKIVHIHWSSRHAGGSH
jgi:limonene-1,2-epoxide hydrolase